MPPEHYMQEALRLARLAPESGDVPVGCVVVQDGLIIGRGYNRRERDHSALAHAEVEAITQACQAAGTWRLSGAQLYVTLEPCPMCAGAIINSRIAAVYYGAKDPKAGACGSVLNLFEEGFNHRPRLYGGILAPDCAALLQDFFQKLR